MHAARFSARKGGYSGTAVGESVKCAALDCPLPKLMEVCVCLIEVDGGACMFDGGVSVFDGGVCVCLCV